MNVGVKPVDCLTGLSLKDDWVVDSIVHRPPTSTGGHFSVGYLAIQSSTGKHGFLKALDFTYLMSQDIVRALNELTSAYMYERNLFEKCKTKRMKRIVIPLSDGTVNVGGNFGLLGNVVYIIFEMAQGDIENEVNKWQNFDLAWALRSLHQSAVGLQELHNEGIAHQDLKQSNLLVFPGEGSKLTDLGRAKDVNIPSDFDDLPIPGDLNYCPPEQWYNWRSSNENDHRFLADVYHLGSLLFFFFLGLSASQAIALKISEQFRKEFRQYEFLHDLPYFQEAFTRALNDFRKSVKQYADDMSEEIVTIASQLCEPDPNRRGGMQKFLPLNTYHTMIYNLIYHDLTV